MRLEVVECLSVSGGAVNEDRVGWAGDLAWVIDGATDVLPEALTPGGSDAAWFAAAMDAELRDVAHDPALSLSDLPELIAQRLSIAFAAVARRPPRDRSEHPSAAAIITRFARSGQIEFVSLGDCMLIAETPDGLARIGIDDADAGDAWVAKALSGTLNERQPEKPLTRDELWPRLQAQRARMNIAYGIFSLTAPAATMIRHGTIACTPGSRVLLATDGLTRLVDVFRTMSAESLFAAAWDRGLAALIADVRGLEQSDATCTAYPRAKTSDDSTGLLLQLKTQGP